MDKWLSRLMNKAPPKRAKGGQLELPLMTERMKADAQNLRKLIREAEALADESMIAFARLKQAMLSARQNPMAGVDAGQRALLRLNQAEGQALSMSTSLLRVHAELSKIGVERLGPEEETPITASAIQHAPELVD